MAGHECKSVGDAWSEMWDELIPLQALGELMKETLTASQAEMVVMVAARSVCLSVEAVQRFEDALKAAGVQLTADAKPATEALA